MAKKKKLSFFHDNSSTFSLGKRELEGITTLMGFGQKRKQKITSKITRVLLEFFSSIMKTLVIARCELVILVIVRTFYYACLIASAKDVARWM